MATLEWLALGEAEHARGVIAELVRILQAQAVDPSAVTLVLAGNFAEAVKRRLGDGAPAYNTERLGGMAAAKTMPRVDGGIDVVVPAPLVLGQDDEDEAREGRAERLLRSPSTRHSMSACGSGVRHCTTPGGSSLADRRTRTSAPARASFSGSTEPNSSPPPRGR
ncbi:hypothetical protein E4P40_09845 [Blastococcus sp. CT_GayMR20]|uniref:hypothetical protein n=1 Tax=Blastococcus sp. CT_GayMR20 TaxID=2559609 RepID=UPI00107476F2|nr:hypothetical protein [Blastococcus sp. CT_GayMR20]TFV88452.1 hypothetical protein E4P40_09845 [Blastococcus sp. CT_GayMR20]